MREQHPEAAIVVRFTQARDYQPLALPQAYAVQFVSRYEAQMLAMAKNGRDARMYFEGYNEIADDQLEAYVLFECERITQMHRLGLNTVWDNCASGTRNDTWDQLAPIVRILGNNDPFGEHDYVAVIEDLDNHYYCQRWLHTHILDGVPKVIIEYGVDYIGDRARRGLWPGVKGWQRHYNQEQFLDILRAGDERYRQYPELMGICVFGMGQVANEWKPFDPSPVWPIVVREQEPWTTMTPEPVQPVPQSIILPIPGARISQNFGENAQNYPNYAGHPGVDLACPLGSNWREWHGTPVRATIAGKAYTIQDNSGYGLYVYIMSDAEDELLAHLSGWTVFNGEMVLPGNIVGYVGYTGNCVPVGGAGTHLHWGKRPRPYQQTNGYKAYVDPLL